jgi:hypothetical protein
VDTGRGTSEDVLRTRAQPPEFAEELAVVRRQRPEQARRLLDLLGSDPTAVTRVATGVHDSAQSGDERRGHVDRQLGMGVSGPHQPSIGDTSAPKRARTQEATSRTTSASRRPPRGSSPSTRTYATTTATTTAPASDDVSGDAAPPPPELPDVDEL